MSEHDDRFEDELRQLFGTVRVPPRLAWQQPGAAPAPHPRRRVARLVAAGLATVVVGGGAAAAAAVGAHRTPEPVASPAPTRTPSSGVTVPPSGTGLPDASSGSSVGGSGSVPPSHPGQTSRPGAPHSPPPASTGWPGLFNTGVRAGVTLRPSAGLTVTRPGTVLQGLDIAGTVTIKAAHVTIRDCRIRGDGDYAVGIAGGDVTIQDSDLSGGSSATIQDGNWRAYRVHIHDAPRDGVRLGSGSVLQDSYVQRVGSAGVRMLYGVSNVTLRHNTVDTPGATAALFLTPEAGPNGSGPIVVRDNLLGGGGWTVYVASGQLGAYHQRGYSFVGNHWLRDAEYGPLSITEPTLAFSTWSGNIFDDTGLAIPL
jgi:hypothetical protein